MQKRILIAEDDELVGEIIDLRLKQCGYATELVRSGPDAIASAEGQPPDLLLCDLWMPGCSGLEVITRLRRAGATYPIIVMTASRYGPEGRQALEAGAVEALLKPFPFLVLKGRIEVLLAAAT